MIAKTTRLALMGLAVLSVAAEPKPATLAEIRKSVDWFALPKPEGAVWEETTLASTKYHVPGKIDAIAEACRKAMTGAGWAEVPRQHPELQLDKYRSFIYAKDGFTIMQYLIAKSQSVEVNLRNCGNVDARKLPRMPGADVKSEDLIYAYYTTKAKPEEAVAFFRKEFVAAGWRETSAQIPKADDKDARWTLRFVQNGMAVAASAWTMDNGTSVNYHTSIRDTFDPADFGVKEIAKPASEKDVIEKLDFRKMPRLGELSAKKNTGARMEYEALASVDKAVIHYRKEFAAGGWTLVTPYANVESRGVLNFEKDGFFASAEIRSVPNRTGFVKVSLRNYGNVDTRQLPHPPGCEVPGERTLIYFVQAKMTPEEIGAFYRKELAKLGWKEEKDLKFEQNGVGLKFYVHEFKNGRTQVQVTQLSEH